MKTKKLFVLISDGGDGSYSPNYTFNEDLINALQLAYDEARMDYDNGIGVDGDGFRYDELTVPADLTYEDLGISPIDDDYADQFAKGVEQEDREDA